MDRIGSPGSSKHIQFTLDALRKLRNNAGDNRLKDVFRFYDDLILYVSEYELLLSVERDARLKELRRSLRFFRVLLCSSILLTSVLCFAVSYMELRGTHFVALLAIIGVSAFISSCVGIAIRSVGIKDLAPRALRDSYYCED